MPSSETDESSEQKRARRKVLLATFVGVAFALVGDDPFLSGLDLKSRATAAMYWVVVLVSFRFALQGAYEGGRAAALRGAKTPAP